MITTTENKAGVGPEYLDNSGAGIAQRLDTLAAGKTGVDERGLNYATFFIADLVMQIERERTDAFRQGAADQREKRKALQQTVAELSNQRDALESLIADRCSELFDVEPSDLSLPDMVEALIEAYQAERVRAGVRAMVPESPAPASYIVLVDGHRIGPMFDTEQAARAQVEELVHANPTYRFALVCRVIDEAKVRHVLQWTFAEEEIL